MKRRLGKPDFGMLDVFKEILETHKEKLIELDYYEEFQECFKENCLNPFIKLEDLLEQFIDFEDEEYEELGNYLLKTLYTHWNAEMAMYREVVYLEVLKHISKYKDVFKKYCDIRELHKTVKFNSINQDELFDYIRSKKLDEKISSAESFAIEGLYYIVKAGENYKDLIAINTNKLLHMSDYFERK